MRSKILILTFIVSMILAVGAANFAVAATGQNSGYVQYKVSVNDPSKPYMQTSATINYSVAPTGQAGFADITLALSSAQTNFTYSKTVNASSLPEIYPYLPELTNQSFSYATQGIALTANLVNLGQTPVTFNGTSYKATNYQISLTAQNASNSQSFTATGTVTSMPSGLISSAQLTLNQTNTVTITLLSTNLSLNAPPATLNIVGASMFGGAIAAVAAVAALAAYRNTKAKKKAAQPQTAEAENSQPSYGVD